MTDSKNLFSLNGKTAVVTGGAGYLGSYFSEVLASFGAAVAVVDLNEEAASQVARRLGRRTAAMAVGCDITDPSSVKVMVSRITRSLGPISILVNNAASKSDRPEEFFKPVGDYSLAEWRKVMSVNIDGLFLVAQAVGNHMIKEKNEGTMIQLASIYGILAPDPRIYEGSLHKGLPISSPPVYAASKGAVVALGRYLAAYWAPHGIRVNTLVPGGVEQGQNEAFKRKYSARVPLGRMAHREDLAGALVFMASDASSYMTGQNIVVDGGLSAW